MDMGEIICAAVTPIVPICVANSYDPSIGEEPELYCTYNFNEIGRTFAESEPDVIVYLIQVHLYAPKGRNVSSIKRHISHALHSAGCTFPEVLNVSDSDSQHYSFECEYFGGWT